MRRTRQAEAALLLALILTPASVASASCSEDAGPDGSPVILLVTAGSTDDGYTTVQVHEVWEGPTQPAVIRLRTGQTESGASSSVDATLAPGRQYVVGASSDLSTSTCSVADADDPRAFGLRPDTVGRPVPADDERGAGSASLWLAIAAAAATAGAGLLLVRRSRGPA